MKNNSLFLTLALIANSCVLEELPQPCEEGWHDENGQCVETSNKTEACGYPEINCLEMTGVISASCESGKCVAVACEASYYLSPDAECISGDGQECDLKEDCDLLPHATAMSCVTNHCRIHKCENNYNLSGNSCIPESMNYCHDNSDCQFPNVSVAVCKDNHCVIEYCKSGYRLFHGRCISASSLLCSNKDECTMLKHAISVDCTGDFLCTALECEEDYLTKDYTDENGASIMLCARENTAVCLTSKDCSKEKPVGTASMKCVDNVCIAETCTDGYRSDILGETCIKIEAKECSTESDCIEEGISVSATCEGNVCQYTECTANYHIKDGVCVDNTITSCGGEGSEYDCTQIPGVVEGESQCNEGQCEAITCKTGYHLADGKCVLNSVTVCGDSGTDCTSLPGVLPDHVDCIDGACISSKCDKDFHINKETKTCTIDTQTSCGTDEINCTLMEAESVSCVDGKCVVNSCSEGQHLKDGICTADTKTECGTGLKNCMEITGVSDAKCLHGDCIATQCKDNYHLLDAACQHDTVNACGKEMKNCQNELTASETVDCQDGKCIAKSCQEGYHILNDLCEKDTPEVCGSSKTNCMTQGVATASCTKGACVVNTCSANYHKKDNKCISDTTNECGNAMADCTQMTGATGGKCQGGSCVVTDCVTGYHKAGNICEGDTNNVCGKTKDDCTNMTGATAGTCKGGVCVATDCVTGYHKAGNICEGDTNNVCGKTKDNCTNMTGATTGTCKSGVCVATDCVTGYHKNGNICEGDTNNVCGKTKANCTNMTGATTGTCKSGVCVATDCVTGYHKDGNVCVKDSVSACGSATRNCMTTGVTSASCNNGKCVVSCSSDYTNDGDYCCRSATLSGASVSNNEYCFNNLYLSIVTQSASFPNLVRIRGTFMPYYESPSTPGKLTSLSMPNLTKLGNAQIENTSLAEISFPKLKTVKNEIKSSETLIAIQNNSKLTSIKMPKLQTIQSGNNGYMWILSNPKLNAISIPNVNIQDALRIQTNTSLTCTAICSGLENATSGYSSISGNKTTSCNVTGNYNPTYNCN